MVWLEFLLFSSLTARSLLARAANGLTGCLFMFCIYRSFLFALFFEGVLVDTFFSAVFPEETDCW